jgi:RNA polymerase sigma-70 factor (ECF subfamily)
MMARLRRRPDSERDVIRSLPPSRTPGVNPRSLDAVGDADLVAAVAAGRPEALEAAYRRNSTAVFGVAKRVIRDVALAEEVVQEVFLRLWRRPERFDATRGSLRSYLLIDAHARAIEVVRSASARRGREDRSVRLDPAPGDDVEREAWELLLADHLRDALDDLTEGEREAIELAYYGGYTYRQVATMLGEPEGTVKSRIRTGLLHLRDRLLAVDIGGESWDAS